MYKYFCLLFPSPTPNNPPEPIAYKPCMICQPVPNGSFHGSINAKSLCILSGLTLKYLAKINKAVPPTVPPIPPKTRNGHTLHCY